MDGWNLDSLGRKCSMRRDHQMVRWCKLVPVGMPSFEILHSFSSLQTLQVLLQSVPSTPVLSCQEAVCNGRRDSFNVMDAVSHALVADAPLPISLLSELGKGPLRKALADLSSDDSVARNLSLWLKLVQTASSPQVTDKHITAASNALCVYLSCSIRSPSSELGQFVLTREVWFEAFHCSQKAFDDGKTKPAFQILDVLCDLLPKLSNPDLVTDIVEKASLPLVRTIVLASPRSAIKKACLVLSCFLRRTPLIQQLGNMIERCVQENEYAWEQRLSEHNIVAADVWGTWKSSTSHLFLALTLAMIDLDTRSAALKMCSVLCNTSEDNPAAPDLQPVLQHVVELYLDRNHAALGSFAENVLPVILHNKEKLLSFIQPYATSCRNDSSRMALFIATIKVGKTKSILSETGMCKCSCKRLDYDH